MDMIEKDARALRRNAAFVGTAFIVATAAGVAAAAIGNPLLEAPGYLGSLASDESAARLAAFLTFFMSVACAGVGLGLYPILRRFSVGLAIGTVGFRLLESMTQVLSGGGVIGLLAVSQHYVDAGAPDAGWFLTVGGVIQSGSAWISNGVTLIFWCIGAFMYYGLFYRHRLVPRWLSVWGLAGISVTVVTSSLVMIGAIPGFGTVQLVSNLPIALQEMVFAVWLIAKGISIKEPAR